MKTKKLSQKAILKIKERLNNKMEEFSKFTDKELDALKGVKMSNTDKKALILCANYKLLNSTLANTDGTDSE